MRSALNNNILYLVVVVVVGCVVFVVLVVVLYTASLKPNVLSINCQSYATLNLLQLIM